MSSNNVFCAMCVCTISDVLVDEADSCFASLIGGDEDLKLLSQLPRSKNSDGSDSLYYDKFATITRTRIRVVD